jgi:hypothetical protein
MPVETAKHLPHCIIFKNLIEMQWNRNFQNMYKGFQLRGMGKRTGHIVGEKKTIFVERRIAEGWMSVYAC